MINHSLLKIVWADGRELSGCSEDPIMSAAPLGCMPASRSVGVSVWVRGPVVFGNDHIEKIDLNFVCLASQRGPWSPTSVFSESRVSMGDGRSHDSNTRNSQTL